MTRNKILVTGATGFIGKTLCRILSEKNIPFISHDKIGLDITVPESFNFSGSEEISTVIHLAGKTFVPDSWKNPAEFIKVNVIGTQNVAEFCRNHQAQLIYVSAYIYGDTNRNPIKEDHPANVNNPYALSKRMGEEIALFYHSVFNVSVSIVRPFNVYGPGQNEMFLIPEVIRQVKKGNEILVKDLFPKRDFIYVDDVVGMILKILETRKQGIFNAGCGKSYSVKELIDCVQEVAGTTLVVKSENKIRDNEISDTIADISKAKKELNWVPQFDLKTGISKCYNF
jgi:nucleoside-diphosphate-sugar epimerase